MVLRAVQQHPPTRCPSGRPNLFGEDLRELLRVAHASRLESPTHAIGDRGGGGGALTSYAADPVRAGSIEHRPRWLVTTTYDG